MDADYTKKEYYDLNLSQSIKVLKQNEIFPYPINPKFITNYYNNPINPNLKITSYLSNSKNPVFFYSCGQMNFHQYVNMKTNDIKQIFPELIINFKKNFDKTMYDVKNMLNYILQINPSTTIYLFGVYPMFENNFERQLLKPIYSLVNKRIKYFFDEYENVNFVDVIDNINFVAPDDCHPNYQGQIYMKKKVINSMIENTK